MLLDIENCWKFERKKCDRNGAGIGAATE
uniref:Uncharacterized protein n=1 Tax=Arundo donax TaxID=35708 RepID=A0A0A9GAN3_ARUDO